MDDGTAASMRENPGMITLVTRSRLRARRRLRRDGAPADLRGRRVVLYFYPKDDTPGCTRQACALRDGWGASRRPGRSLFGVSPTTSRATCASSEKFGLPFPLLADTDHAVAEAYGVWVEKANYGK